MSATLWEFLVYHSLRLIVRSGCCKKMVEDFWDVHFSSIIVEDRVIDSNMDGFPGNFFVVLFCYLKVGDVGSEVIAGNVWM